MEPLDNHGIPQVLSAQSGYVPQELFHEMGWRITREIAPLPDGRVKEGLRVHRCDTAHVVALTENGNMLLLREFRPFYGSYIWMIPSGKIDKETDITLAAQRELQEETGYKAHSLRHLHTVYTAESINIAHHIFLGTKLEPAPLPGDADELIEVHTLPVEEALQNVLSSSHIHLISAFAILSHLRSTSRT